MNEFNNAKTTILMKSFIENYLLDPSQAIADARQMSQTDSWSENIDEDQIYSQIASGEFRLYEEIIFSTSAEDSPRAENYAVVA